MTELLVTMGIVIVLTAILVPALSSMMTSGERSKVVTAMQKLMAAHDEYEATTGEPINIEGDFPIEWVGEDNRKRKNAPGKDDLGNPDVMSSIERFVWAAQQTQAGKTLVNGVPDDLLVDKDNDGAGDGFLEVRDPWGAMLVYRPFAPEPDAVGPNRKYQNPSNNHNYETYVNIPFGGGGVEKLRVHYDPFVASAGPDGRWGTPDDIYSFELQR